MGRPVYPHELSDSDFSWLINNYRESHPQITVIESSCLPVVLIRDESVKTTEDVPVTPMPPPVDEDGDLDAADQSESEQ